MFGSLFDDDDGGDDFFGRTLLAFRLISGLGFRTSGEWYNSGREISSRALGKVDEAKRKFHHFVLTNKFPRTKKGVKTEIINFHLVQQGRKRFKQYVIRVCGKEARVHFRKLKPEEQKAIKSYKNRKSAVHFGSVTLNHTCKENFLDNCPQAYSERTQKGEEYLYWFLVEAVGTSKTDAKGWLTKSVTHPPSRPSNIPIFDFIPCELVEELPPSPAKEIPPSSTRNVQNYSNYSSKNLKDSSKKKKKKKISALKYREENRKSNIKRKTPPIVKRNPPRKRKRRASAPAVSSGSKKKRKLKHVCGWGKTDGDWEP